VGVTVPLPVYNRNQGNIARARIGVTQTATQLADVELRTIAEVEQAARQFEVSKAAAERIEKRLLPSATKIRQAAEVRFTAGEADAIELLSAQRGYNDVVRQFRDTLIRHRRSSLRLNTAVGRRLLP
jgi:cobalt-zinc-cadmium efflux system outer membrane protein